jgi:hypothetical protein
MEAMKYSPYRIAMCLCQPGIVLSFFWIGPNNEYWFEEGVLYAILFTVTVVVLLDMPRGVSDGAWPGAMLSLLRPFFAGGGLFPTQPYHRRGSWRPFS